MLTLSIFYLFMNQILDKSYIKFLDDLKIQIKQSRIKAHLSVNRELILLYYKIGLAILEKQKEEGWGSKIIEKISLDLRKAFPEMKGLSITNLSSMKRFADIYLSEIKKLEFLHQAGGEMIENPIFNIPWRHHVEIMEQVSNINEREPEDHLINNITKFLLELGKGFAFIGKKYHIEVGGQDFYI